MGMVALLVVGVVVWVGALPALQPGARQPLARAEGWVRRSVPPGQVVLVDLATWPDLVDRDPSPGRLVRRRGQGTGAELGAVVERRLPRHDRRRARRIDGRRPGRPRPVAARRPVRHGRGRGGGAGRPQRLGARRRPRHRPRRRSGAPPRRAGAPAPSSRRTRASPSTAPTARCCRAGRSTAASPSSSASCSPCTPSPIGGFPALAGDPGTVRRQVVISAIDGHPVPADADATGTVLRYLSEQRGDYATSTIDATDAGVLATFAPDPTFVPPS